MEDYVTTIANEKKCTHTVCGNTFELLLHDTRGLAEMQTFEDRYFQMDGWILVYSVDQRRSFDMLNEIFDTLKVEMNEKKHLPIVVVGNKTDLGGERVVTTKEGQEFAKGITATHLECSAKENINIAQIFDVLIKDIQKSRGEPLSDKDGGCTIL